MIQETSGNKTNAFQNITAMRNVKIVPKVSLILTEANFQRILPSLRESKGS